MMGAASESLKFLFNSSQNLEGVFAFSGGGPMMFPSIDLLTLIITVMRERSPDNIFLFHGLLLREC